MKNGQMLYRHPGRYYIHNDWYDYTIVHKDEVEAHLKQGWHLSTKEAHFAAIKEKMGPKRKKGKRKIGDLSAAEIQKIVNSNATYKQLAVKYNVSVYMIKKLKGGDK